MKVRPPVTFAQPTFLSAAFFFSVSVFFCIISTRFLSLLVFAIVVRVLTPADTINYKVSKPSFSADSVTSHTFLKLFSRKFLSFTHCISLRRQLLCCLRARPRSLPWEQLQTAAPSKCSEIPPNETVESLSARVGNEFYDIQPGRRVEFHWHIFFASVGLFYSLLRLQYIIRIPF